MRRTAVLEKTRTFGPAYVQGLDLDRITGQLRDVLDFMLRSPGSWHTLDQIAHATGHPSVSVSADLRHLRKDRFGRWQVNKRRDERYPGLWFYQLLPPVPLGIEGQLSLLEVP